jgi:hypothetical protein
MRFAPSLVVLAVAATGTVRADVGHVDFVEQVLAHQAQPDARDRSGLRRDTWYFFGYQWVTIGALYFAPESVSSWSDEQKEEYSLSIWWDNVTHPKMDSDDVYINYVLHPYWGGAYYVRARERGYSDKQAFWYSVFLSSAYEFGAEALFENPSIQDLIVTPVVGSMVGKYFIRVRGDIVDRDAQGLARTTRDKWVWVLTDPLGALNTRVDALLGRDARFQIRPYYRKQSFVAANSPAMAEWREDIVYGIEFRLEW